MGDETIYGVDFSASAAHSGHRTWLTKAEPRSNGTLRVEWVKCATDALSESLVRREETLPELVDFLGAKEKAVVGLDFPFSLSKDIIDEFFEAEDWEAFVQEFPNEWESPAEMFHAVNDTALETARKTDEANDGQDPTGWRIKTQTYYGIRDVLSPLVDDDSHVGSLREAAGGPTLLETYPAAVFSSLDLHREGYKDVPEESREKRTENLRGLQYRGVFVPDDYAEVARHNDDALDSLASAFGAWRACTDENGTEETDIEGRIYV